MDGFVSYLDVGEEGIKDYVDKFSKHVADYQQKLLEMKTTNEKIMAGQLPLVIAPYSDKDIEDQEKATTAMEMMLAYLKAFSATQTTTGSGGSDPRLANLKEEVSLLEKVYDKYQDYAKIMDVAKAKRKTMTYFKDTIGDLRFGAAFDAKDLAAILSKYKEEARKLPKSEKLVLEIGFKAEDALWKEEEKTLEQKLKDLEEKVSRSETARNFFNDILSKTGDRELAGDLTLSVFGDTGNLEDNMIDQILQAFDELPEELSPKLSDAVDKATKMIDFNKLEALIASLPESAQDAAKKIVSNGKKANADWLKDLYNTYAKSQTYAARIQAERDKADEQKKKVALSTDLSPSEKNKQTAAIEKYRDKQIAKILTEELKNSDDWIKVFENVDRVGTSSINHLLDIIKQFIEANKEDLEPEALRSLMSEYNKLYEESINRNPFKAIGDAMKEYVLAMAKFRTAKSMQDNMDLSSVIISTAKSDVDEAKAALAAAKSEEDKADAAVRLEIAESNLAHAQSLAADTARDEMEAEDDLRRAMDKLQKGVDGVGKLFSKFETALSSVHDVFVSLGGSESSDFVAVLDGVSDSMGDVVKITSALVAGIIAVGAAIDVAATLAESHPIILAATAILAAVIAIVKVISNIKVNRANREIDRQSKLLDSLERSYKRLEAAQAKAFGTDYIDNYNARMAALVAEQEAYEKQAAAERSKGKKADEDKIRDYENSAEDTADKIKEMASELSEFFTDMDVTSAAKDFAQAWLDAYVEFGNTTDAIQEKFSEMVKNMVINSLMAKVVQSVLQPIFDSIDEMASDGELSSEEIASIADRIPQAIADIDNGLSNVVKDLQASGVNLRETGGNLTGISRDIASASEESILGLAAGINTQNFYISQIHANVAQILLLMQGNGAQLAQTAVAGTSLMVENPFLTQYLPSIDQHTANIEAYCAETLATLNKVIKPRGTQGAFVVNSSLS